MPAGRPPMGARLVDRFSASDDAKRKLKVILESVTGETSIPEACVKLGVSETRFYQLREEALSAALQSLEPAAIGRPRKEEVFSEAEVEALRRRVAELENDLVLSNVKTSIAAELPHLLKEETQKKTDWKKEMRRVRKAERKRRGR
jgi:hypothetical protein